MTAAPREFLEYVDAHKDAFVKRLANAIAIPRYGKSFEVKFLWTNKINILL